MNGDRRTHVKRILEAIENGTLPPPETERRLCELIEHEVTRTDASPDEEFISACIALWDELHSQDSTDYVERAAQLRLRIDSTLCTLQKRQKRNRVLTKVAAAVAAVIVLVVGISLPVRWIWFDSWSTPDEQQHVIMGHEISVEMVDTAIAENENRGSIVVDDVSELRQLLGFDLNIPLTIGDGWQVKNCTLWFLTGYIKVGVIYEHPDRVGSSLTCTIHIYNDIEYAYFSFEQSRDGHSLIIGNQELYISQNVARTTVNWYNNLMYVRLVGSVSEDEAVNLMLELIGGNNE